MYNFLIERNYLIINELRFVIKTASLLVRLHILFITIPTSRWVRGRLLRLRKDNDFLFAVVRLSDFSSLSLIHHKDFKG